MALRMRVGAWAGLVGVVSVGLGSAGRAHASTPVSGELRPSVSDTTAATPPPAPADVEFGAFEIHGVQVEYRGQPHPDVVQFNGNTLVDAPKKGELRIGAGLTITRLENGEIAVNGQDVPGSARVTQISFNRSATVFVGHAEFDQPGTKHGWLKWLSSWTH